MNGYCIFYMQWSRVWWCLQMRKSVMIIWCGWSCYVVLVKNLPIMKIVFTRYKSKWNEDHKSFMALESRKYSSVVTNLIFLKFLQTPSGFKKNCNHVKWSCSVLSSKVIFFLWGLDYKLTNTSDELPLQS